MYFPKYRILEPECPVCGRSCEWVLNSLWDIGETVGCNRCMTRVAGEEYFRGRPSPVCPNCGEYDPPYIWTRGYGGRAVGCDYCLDEQPAYNPVLDLPYRIV